MSRLTSRYENEAARKEFFTRLAATTEAIHLCTSHERMDDLFENRDSDRIVDIVLREVATLVKSLFDPDENLREELAEGRHELSHSRSIWKIGGLPGRTRPRLHAGKPILLLQNPHLLILDAGVPNARPTA